MLIFSCAALQKTIDETKRSRKQVQYLVWCMQGKIIRMVLKSRSKQPGLK